MHPDQLHPTAETVEALVRTQLPRLHGPVRPVHSAGTVNALFRVGDHLVARLPLRPIDLRAAVAALDAELAVAHRLLGAGLPVATPEPVAVGAPGHGYPMPWSLWRWLPGTTAADAGVRGSLAFASDLAEVVTALRALDTGGATHTGPGRGGRLADHEEAVRGYVAAAGDMADPAALAALWDRLRRAGRADDPDRWTHGDLMPGNLLTSAGRLTAVIDVGGTRPADPALDLMPAWNLLTATARAAFRAALGDDEPRWRRGGAWAYVQAIGCLAYYRETNPVMSATAARTLAALAEDFPA